MGSRIAYCKIFGERNTGTNAMFQLLHKNTTMAMRIIISMRDGVKI